MRQSEHSDQDRWDADRMPDVDWDDLQLRTYLANCSSKERLLLVDMQFLDALLVSTYGELPAISDERICRAIHTIDATPVEPPKALATFSFFGGAWQGAMAYSDEHPVRFSYLVASVLFVIVGFVASYIYVTNHPEQQIAWTGTKQLPQESELTRNPPSPAENATIGVAHITNRNNCQWQNDKLAPTTDRIMQGDKFSLKSGLLEIVYDTGARVILQGPCTYTVESKIGGFLAVGKVTAKLEKKVAGRAGSNTSSPSLPVSKSPGLFFVRTPTAVVTDLGTEFGVEVDRSGATESHVFRGRVKIAMLDIAGGNRHQRPTEGQEVVLNQNESARVEKPENGDTRLVVHHGDARPLAFVRSLHKPTESQPDGMSTSKNIVLWLKADSIRDVRDGASIRTWSDSSGKGNQMYQDVDSQKPVYIAGTSSGLNNMPVVRFSGKGFLSAPTPGCVTPSGAIQGLAAPFTLFCVAKNTDDGEADMVRGYLGGGANCLAFGVARIREKGSINPGWAEAEPKNSFWIWTPRAMNVYGQAASIDTKWNVHGYAIPDLKPDHWTWYRNAAALGSVGRASGQIRQYGSTIYIGYSGNSKEFWLGDIAEILVFDKVLTDAEREPVTRYLQKKYGISTAAPTRSGDGEEKKSGSSVPAKSATGGK